MDTNFQQRKFIKASRPSAGRNLINKKLQTPIKDELKNIKRKNNDDCQSEHKRLRNDNCTPKNRSSLTSTTPINLANERLTKLRRSLSERKNESAHNSTLVSNRANLGPSNNLKTNSAVSQTSRKSIQDRLAVKRNVNLSTSAASSSKSTSTKYNIKKLNRSFPSCSREVIRDQIFSIDTAGRIRNVEIPVSPPTISTPVKRDDRLSFSCSIHRHSVSAQSTSDKFNDVNSNETTSDSAGDKSSTRDYNDFSEDMDWSPVNENIVIENISVVRKQLDYREHRVDVPQLADVNKPAVSGLYIVVDTNIFLSHLQYLSELKDKKFTDTGPTVIMVPWMVLQELDYMKDGHSHKSLKASARKAVNFINTCLLNKDPHLKGQSIMDASNQDTRSNNPDDGILFCCLQLLRQGKDVVLLSNDKNLRNKAMISEVRAYDRDELVRRLTEDVAGRTRTHSVERVRLVLGNCLSRIVEQEMEAAYGSELWQRMAHLTPPLTLDEGLQCLRRYWMPVFSFKLLKHCKPCIDDFNSFLLTTLRSRDSLSAEQFTKFVEFCLRLCIYLKNAFDQHRPHITETINFIQSCASVDA